MPRAGITAAGQRFCWRLGRRPGERPAGGGTTLTGFPRPPRAAAQAFLSLYGSDQIKTNLKELFSLVVVPLIRAICRNSNYILKKGVVPFTVCKLPQQS